MQISKKVNPYVRILGFNQKGRGLLSEILDRNPKIDLFTSVKKFLDTNTNKNLKEMICKDIFATDIYTLGYGNNASAKLDFTNKIVKKD